MDYQEFRVNTVKANTRKHAKVRGSYGVYDAYKHIRKNKWYDIGRPVKEHEFYSIVRKVNDLLADEIALGHTVTFPSRMGYLELRKIENGVSIVDGKLKVTYPINWDETLRLWFEDEEAKKEKTLVRDEDKYRYRVRYCKYDATYENKSFYQFDLNRFIRKKLKENIKSNKTDTLW